jgi:hypothetical protein
MKLVVCFVHGLFVVVVTNVAAVSAAAAVHPIVVILVLLQMLARILVVIRRTVAAARGGDHATHCPASSPPWRRFALVVPSAFVVDPAMIMRAIVATFAFVIVVVVVVVQEPAHEVEAVKVKVIFRVAFVAAIPSSSFSVSFPAFSSSDPARRHFEFFFEQFDNRGVTVTNVAAAPPWCCSGDAAALLLDIVFVVLTAVGALFWIHPEESVRRCC